MYIKIALHVYISYTTLISELLTEKQQPSVSFHNFLWKWIILQA